MHIHHLSHTVLLLEMSYFRMGDFSRPVSNRKAVETSMGTQGSGRGSPRGSPWNNSRSIALQKKMPVYPPWPFGKVLLCIHKSDLEGGQDDKSPRGLANDEDDEDHQLADWLAGFRKRLANEISDKRIKEIEYIASYSWLQGHKPKVIIPGKPSAWTPIKGAQKLKQDSGDFFRDVNAAHYPSYPTQPAVEAVLKQNPNFMKENIQIFACGSTMGNLLRFARGTDDTFRFGIELVGKTVFFVRQEKHPKELIPDVFGYGHTFPARYTAWEADVKGSKSHQRIISYNFSGIKCAVRFECDGYLKYLAHPGERQASGSTMSKVIRDETVTASLEQLSIGETESSQNSLEVQSAGEVVPQGSIFDLKTRSNRKEIDMSQMYPRLWVSQIPNFIVAYHTQGLFKDEDIHVKDVRDEVIKWQEENQASVKRLHVLLNLIIEFAKTANQNKQLEICRNEVDTIEIRERGAADNLRVLPDSLLDTWEGGSTGLGDESPGVSDIDHNITDDWPEPDSDAESEKDYTACSASGCGYCGHCRY